MATRKEGVQFGLDRSSLKDPIGRLPVSDFPMKNMIGLFFSIFSENWGVGIKGPVWIHQHRKILIVHFDQFRGIGCSVTIFGHHERDLLSLKQYFPCRQDHLLVMEQSRHPSESRLFEVLPRNDR